MKSVIVHESIINELLRRHTIVSIMEARINGYGFIRAVQRRWTLCSKGGLRPYFKQEGFLFLNNKLCTSKATLRVSYKWGS